MAVQWGRGERNHTQFPHTFVFERNRYRDNGAEFGACESEEKERKKEEKTESRERIQNYPVFLVLIANIGHRQNVLAVPLLKAWVTTLITGFKAMPKTLNSFVHMLGGGLFLLHVCSNNTVINQTVFEGNEANFGAAIGVSQQCLSKVYSVESYSANESCIDVAFGGRAVGEILDRRF